MPVRLSIHTSPVFIVWHPAVVVQLLLISSILMAYFAAPVTKVQLMVWVDGAMVPVGEVITGTVKTGHGIGVDVGDKEVVGVVLTFPKLERSEAKSDRVTIPESSRSVAALNPLSVDFLPKFEIIRVKSVNVTLPSQFTSPSGWQWLLWADAVVDVNKTNP